MIDENEVQELFNKVYDAIEARKWAVERAFDILSMKGQGYPNVEDVLTGAEKLREYILKDAEETKAEYLTDDDAVCFCADDNDIDSVEVDTTQEKVDLLNDYKDAEKRMKTYTEKEQWPYGKPIVPLDWVTVPPAVPMNAAVGDYEQDKE